jgi:anti-sigma regulatory factor (Ser/Thr protein kinase)
MTALPLGPGRTGEVKIIVSELVTNSIEHADLGAHDRIELRALVDRRGALHVEVRDPGPGPQPGADRGMGWRILERMADRWGIDRRDGVARVWFELDAAPWKRTRGGAPVRGRPRRGCATRRMVASGAPGPKIDHGGR